MKYGPFFNMRFMSSSDSNTNTKNPLPLKWLLIHSLTRDCQLLFIQASTTLGMGHSLVNCPISPRSARSKPICRVLQSAEQLWEWFPLFLQTSASFHLLAVYFMPLPVSETPTAQSKNLSNRAEMCSAPTLLFVHV